MDVPPTQWDDLGRGTTYRSTALLLPVVSKASLQGCGTLSHLLFPSRIYHYRKIAVIYLIGVLC